eukprot:7206-Heterococcus_DN1.PRE.2
MSPPSEKQALAACSNALLQAGLLKMTLDFVGLNWKACYDNLMIARQQSSSEEHFHTSSCTSCQAVFTSASRVRAAHDSGLRLHEANKQLSSCAGTYADFDTLEAAHDLGLPFSAYVMRGAASSRCLSKLQRLHIEQQCPFPGEITLIAARAGYAVASMSGLVSDLDVLQFLHAEGYPWRPNVCGAAGEAGDLEQLKWLFSHGATEDNSTAMIAARGGAVHVLEWLQQQQDVELKEHTMCCAAERGHLQLCQWLHAQQCPWDNTATFAAARYNHCATLRWLIESGCPHDGKKGTGARNGDFSILQYLYECGIMVNPAALTDALNVAGSLDVLAVAQWLRQRGAEWPACPMRNTRSSAAFLTAALCVHAGKSLYECAALNCVQLVSSSILLHSSEPQVASACSKACADTMRCSHVNVFYRCSNSSGIKALALSAAVASVVISLRGAYC